MGRKEKYIKSKSYANISWDIRYDLTDSIAIGYNLGTPALKPYKREIKTYQNDTIMWEKAM